MTRAQLIKKLGALGLTEPMYGTGHNGRVLNSDLEDVISEHFAQSLTTWGQKARYSLGNVMLAARYDECTEQERELLFSDDSPWYMEEKYNGVRITLFAHPDEGFSAFSRNRSKVTCLPLEYTRNILVPDDGSWRHLYEVTPHGGAAMIDCELVTGGFVELPDGTFATGLQAVTSVLSQDDPEVAAHMQRTTCPLTLVAFDFLPANEDGTLLLGEVFDTRRELLQEWAANNPSVLTGKLHSRNKESIYSQYLDSGKEGVVFKHEQGLYVPARNNRRDRNTCVKCKRSMRGAGTSDIDVWIGGAYATPEWSKRGLIGGLELYTYLDNGDERTVHNIANVASMPDEMRIALSRNGDLNPEYLGAVITIDGQDVSARNRKITHARADWKRGFRQDKSESDCVLDEEFLNSQIF